LGEIARRRRQLDAAVNLHDQSASLFAAAGDAIGEAAALTNLAATRLDVGELEDAEAAVALALDRTGAPNASSSAMPSSPA